jgi:uncharacterized Tic20 family protein
MEAKEQNYGTVGGPESPVGAMATQEERTWSVLSHLSVFLNMFTVVLGPVAALIVWLVYKDRSEMVAFQSLQAMWYQVTGLLTFILIGFLLVPVMALATLVPFIHGAYAAYRIGRDGEYRYPIIADMIDGR